VAGDLSPTPPAQSAVHRCLRNVTRPEYVEAAVRQLQAAPVRYILGTPRLNSPDPLEGEAVYHLVPFRTFVNERYRKVHTFADGDEVWELK
jgi:hypothetical protein